MKIKYESPQLEIYKFSLSIKALTDSNTQETTHGVIGPGGDIEGGEGGDNPFG